MKTVFAEIAVVIFGSLAVGIVLTFPIWLAALMHLAVS